MRPAGARGTLPAMKVFISGASADFQEHRKALATDLRGLNHQTMEQEDFQVGTGTLWQKLRDAIEGCDMVIALIGRAYGAEPVPGEAPPTARTHSYTQWEYLLACGERGQGERAAKPKPLLRFIADEALPWHWPPSPDDAFDADKQRQFIRDVLASGADRGTFSRTDINGCCRVVLRSFPQRPTRRLRLTLSSLVALACAVLATGLEATRPGQAGLVALQPASGEARLAAETEWVARLATGLVHTLQTGVPGLSDRREGLVPALRQAPALSIAGTVAVDGDALRLQLRAKSTVTGDQTSPPTMAFLVQEARLYPSELVEAVLLHLAVSRTSGRVYDNATRPPQLPRATLLQLAARSALKTGKQDEAIALLKRALDVSPNFAVARAQLRDLLPPEPAPPRAKQDEDLGTPPPLNGTDGDAVPVFARLLRGKPLLPAGDSPLLQVVESTPWQTRLTTVFFPRAGYTLRVIEPPAQALGAGMTIDDSAAGAAVLVSNGGDFIRDQQGQLGYDGHVVVNGAVSSDKPSAKAGALVVNRGGGIDILYDRTRRFNGLLRSLHALQAGPVLVEPTRQWGHGDKAFRASRTAVCLTPTHFGFVFVEALGDADRLPPQESRRRFAGGMYLQELGYLLHKARRDGGMECDAAIAMDGGASTGFVYRGSEKTVTSTGNKRRVMTLLAVEQRTPKAQ